MKKILSILIMFFAFTLNSQAQEAKQQVKRTPQELAKQDVFEITKAIDTNGNDQFFVDLNNLFIKKHTMLQDAKTEAEKQQISQMIDAKLKATFNADQLRILSSTDLYHRLIH